MELHENTRDLTHHKHGENELSEYLPHEKPPNSIFIMPYKSDS
jgi:hypothetical protein